MKNKLMALLFPVVKLWTDSSDRTKGIVAVLLGIFFIHYIMPFFLSLMLP